MNNWKYTSRESKLFQRLNTPEKIQDYLNLLPFNFEKKKETCMSPRLVLSNKTAHCMEGAMFAAAVLEFHAREPWILDLRSEKDPYDYDHVVAIFKEDGFYGAISKTNHNVLRYREPIYKSVRELVMSYFHEYFLDNGRKTLREYSELLDLNYFNKINWRTSEKDLFSIPKHLDKIKHHPILSKKQINNLRKVDRIEVKAGNIYEHFKK
ncbi:hypothetical protein H0W91_01165 [Patescibacteria group bacterium]|nr:hypothetical protein [Patescibacteria group bacterium]